MRATISSWEGRGETLGSYHKLLFTWSTGLKGKMPVEVLRFMDALRQAWSEDGTVLRITTHPYSSKADCTIGSFLNPYLCPRWVNWIMTKNDAMAKVLKWLPERYGAHVTAFPFVESILPFCVIFTWTERYRGPSPKNIMAHTAMEVVGKMVGQTVIYTRLQNRERRGTSMPSKSDLSYGDGVLRKA